MKRYLLIIAVILSITGVLNAQYINSMGFPTNDKPQNYQANTNKSSLEIEASTIINVIPCPVSYPADIAFDGTLIWIEGYAEYYLYGINPTNGEVVDSISIDIKRPYGLTFDGTYFWVLDNDNKNIEKIEKETGLVVDNISISIQEDTYPTSVDIINGNLWYNDTRGSYPSFEGDVTRRIDKSGNFLNYDSLNLEYPTGIVKRANVIWITDNVTQTINEINTETMTIIRSINAPGGLYPNGLTFDGRCLWVANNDADSLYQIDVGYSQLEAINAPVLEDVVAECSATVNVPTATDYWGEAIFGQTSSELDYNEQGIHTIDWTFISTNEDTLIVSQNIIIEDITDPVINCNNDSIIMTESGINNYLVIGNEFDPTYFDNCEIESVTNSYNNSNSLEGAVFDNGTTTVEWTITDMAGNTSTCSNDITIETTFTNIDNNKANNNISVYPNPNNGSFTVLYNQTFNENLELTIIDITGKIIYTKTTNTENTNINLDKINSGAYYLIINDNNNLTTQKLIITE